jgi:hypothetical protein
MPSALSCGFYLSTVMLSLSLSRCNIGGNAIGEGYNEDDESKENDNNE